MSEDELTVRVVIDDSQFRDELTRLRQDLEEQYRVEVDKPKQEPTKEEYDRGTGMAGTVTIATDTGRVDDDLRNTVAQLKEDVNTLRTQSSTIGVSESRTTPGTLMRDLSEAIEQYVPATRFMMKQGERGGDDELSTEGAEVISMIQGIMDEYGADAQLGFMPSSDASAMMYLRRLIELFKRDRMQEAFSQDIGSTGTAMKFLHKARTSRARGPTRTMHTGMEMSLQQLASMVKGEGVTTGREAMVPGGMFLDFSMSTDETRYFGEIKTGDVGRGDVGQIREYYDAIITDEMMKERGLSPSDPMPSPFEVSAWAVDRANVMMQRREAGEDVPPFAKSILAAPYFAGDVKAQIRRALGSSTIAGPFVSYGQGGGEDDLLQTVYPKIPAAAIKYINEGMDAIKRSGTEGTPEHWNQLHMQWVAKFPNRSYSKTLIKGLNVILDPEGLRDSLDSLREEFSDELWDRIQSGNALAPQAARAEFYKRFKEFIDQQATAQGRPITDTDIRGDVMRPLVPSGVIEPSPRGRGRIRTLIRRGTSWMADQAMLSVDERTEAQRIATTRGLMTHEPIDESGLINIAQVREMQSRIPMLERELWELYGDDVLDYMVDPQSPAYAGVPEDMLPEEALIQGPLRGARAARDLAYNRLFTGKGVPMDIDPAEYMAELDKTAKQMGFRTVGALQANIKERIVGMAAITREKIMNEEINMTLRRQMASMAPDFFQIVAGMPVTPERQIDPERMSEFIKGFVDERINVDSYKKMSEQLNKIISNPVLAATLGENNLSGLANPAQQMKRFEESFVGLEPAYGGSLTFWK